jgi:hypothetical protein
MRTTLDIDEDVLEAVKELATLHGKTMGKTLSDLARRGLEPRDEAPEVRSGVPILRARPGSRPVSLETVNRMRDDEGEDGG